MVAVASTSLGCGLLDDDPDVNIDTGGAGSGGVVECVNEWSELSCPAPALPVFTVDLQGDDILWVDDPINATTVGPGGWLFGTITGADSVGWIVGGDNQCGMACILPPVHPCSTPGNQYCNPDPLDSGCLWCGPGTGSDCADFASVCLGDDDPTGSDTDTSGGAVDSSSGGAGAHESEPDMSMFTSNPEVEFGTTQRVLDLLGDSAPENLSADDGCSDWDPRGAVESWFGEPILQKEAFDKIVDEAELVLGYCDGLRLSLERDGVLLKTAERQTLAYELGFRAGDVIVSINGIPSTDALALRSEAIILSQSSPSAVTVLFSRDGRKQFKTLRIQ